MNTIVKNKLSEVETVCRACNVRRLWVFGSGAGQGFNPPASDLDFAVEFRDMPPAAHSDCFFKLLESLESLFGCAVDLLELDPVTNPFLKQSIAESRVMIFDAA